MNTLVTLYQQRLNLQDAVFLQIDHEDAIVATVYKITQPNGAHLILKICSRPQDYLREVYFLQYFADKLPVPRILQLVQPEAGVDGAVLMECLPGTLLKMSDFTDALAYEMGALLARIHLNRTTGYGDLTQPDKLSHDPSVYFIPKYEEGFVECSNHLPQDLIDQCRRYYEAHLDLLAAVDGPCIIHRDFRAGNVLVNKGKIQGIIDWSSGRASFAEEDFCPLEHGEWPNNPAGKKSFLEGYASIRRIPDYKAIMPLLRMSRAIATIGFTVKSRTWETNNARLYQYNRRFLETFFKVK